MSHPHNRDWPDDYLPTPVEIHMNFARMLIDEIDPDWVFMNTLELLYALATHGIVLAPDFKGTANYGYLAAVAPGAGENGSYGPWGGPVPRQPGDPGPQQDVPA